MRSGVLDSFGRPAGDTWGSLMFPDIADAGMYALEIEGNEFDPIFRDCDLIIVSPQSNPGVGDRVIAGTTENEIIIGELKRKTLSEIEIQHPCPNVEARGLRPDQVSWLARIVWVSQ